MSSAVHKLSDLPYKPLIQPHDEIRLILLRPRSYQPSDDSTSDIVCCELINVARGNSCPPYTAISYAWDNQPVLSKLFMNQRAYEVSLNVEQALRQLRHERDHTYVWVDQLCINQQDDDEKSCQVQQMRHVYKEAERVVAWLGPTTHDSGMLLAHIKQMADAVWTESVDVIVDAYRQPEKAQAISAAFRALCSLGYWKRLWVMQEFAVASKLYIAWGDCMIEDIYLLSWVHFFTKQIYQTDHLFSQAAEALRAALIQAYTPPEKSFLQNNTTRRTRYQSGSCSEDSVCRVLITTLVLENDKNYPLTTEPKDRILALLHLAHDAEQFNTITDYSLTCEEIYQRAATIMLQQGHIDLLSCCQFPGDSLEQSDVLPSWVPDWREPLRMPCCGAPWLNNFSAFPRSPPQLMPSFGQSQLTLSGVFVDQLQECGYVCSLPCSELLSHKYAVEYLTSLESLCSQSQSYTTPDEKYYAVLETATAADDVRRYRKENASKMWHMLLSSQQEVRDPYITRISLEAKSTSTAPLSETMSAERFRDKDAWNMYLYARRFRRLHSRRTFISSAGRIGLAPRHSQSGDRICVFSGGKIPYLVRPRHDGSGAYTLVGEAYVHGLMFGEYFADKPDTALEPIVLCLQYALEHIFIPPDI